jgi:hypothetical protein
VVMYEYAVPKSFSLRAADIARLVIRLSVLRSLSSWSVRDDSVSAKTLSGGLGSPALTRLLPMERRSSSFV